MPSPRWLRSLGLLLGLVPCLASTGCGLAAAAAVAALQDQIGGDDDGGDNPADTRPSVAVVYSFPAGTHASDVVDRLTATGSFSSVTGLDAAGATPSLAELEQYDAVLVVADRAFRSPDALGDVLASYADGGGGVVTAVHARPEGEIAGAWSAGDYEAIHAPGTLSGDGPVAWQADVAVHPIVAGLVLPGGGTGSDRPDVATVTAGTTLVASWATGEPLVAVRAIATGARVVGLGFHVVTDALDPSFVDADSDAIALVARALRWVLLEI